jgi:hypothetical protein
MSNKRLKHFNVYKMYLLDFKISHFSLLNIYESKSNYYSYNLRAISKQSFSFWS